MSSTYDATAITTSQDGNYVQQIPVDVFFYKIDEIKTTDLPNGKVIIGNILNMHVVHSIAGTAPDTGVELRIELSPGLEFYVNYERGTCKMPSLSVKVCTITGSYGSGKQTDFSETLKVLPLDSNPNRWIKASILKNGVIVDQSLHTKIFNFEITPSDVTISAQQTSYTVKAGEYVTIPFTSGTLGPGDAFGFFMNVESVGSKGKLDIENNTWCTSTGTKCSVQYPSTSSMVGTPTWNLSLHASPDASGSFQVTLKGGSQVRDPNPNNNAAIIIVNVFPQEDSPSPPLSSDVDDDGIPNTQDACPFEPGSQQNNGCPAVNQQVDLRFKQNTFLAKTASDLSTNLKAGSPIRIGQDIENIGNTPAGPFCYSMTLTDQSGRLVSSYNKIQRQTLSTHERCYDANTSLSVGYGAYHEITIAEPGTYTVTFVADYKNQVTETNEQNNVAVNTIVVGLPLHADCIDEKTKMLTECDKTPSSDSFDMTVIRDTTWRETPNNGPLYNDSVLQPNDQFHIWYKIKNLGPNVATGTLTVTTTPGITITSANGGDCTNTGNTATCRSLNPGVGWNDYRIPYNFKVNSNVKSGTETITAVLTPNISGETNNAPNESVINFAVSQQSGEITPSPSLNCKKEFSAYSTITPNIDGVSSYNEWKDADSVKCQFTHNGNSYTLDASFKNDNENLYSKLIILGPDVSFGFFGSSFDIANNPDILNDSIGSHIISGKTYYNDDFWKPYQGSERDVNHGGTFDVIAGQTQTSTKRTLEISHPLCSGDDKDFCLTPGSRIPFDIIWNNNNVIDINRSDKFYYLVPTQSMIRHDDMDLSDTKPSKSDSKESDKKTTDKKKTDTKKTVKKTDTKKTDKKTTDKKKTDTKKTVKKTDTKKTDKKTTDKKKTDTKKTVKKSSSKMLDK